MKLIDFGDVFRSSQFKVFQSALAEGGVVKAIAVKVAVPRLLRMLDRLRLGYVVDFVDVYWSGWHFWAFNVADAAITVGVALMILDLMGLGTRHVSRAV